MSSVKWYRVSLVDHEQFHDSFNFQICLLNFCKVHVPSISSTCLSLILNSIAFDLDSLVRNRITAFKCYRKLKTHHFVRAKMRRMRFDCNMNTRPWSMDEISLNDILSPRCTTIVAEAAIKLHWCGTRAMQSNPIDELKICISMRPVINSQCIGSFIHSTCIDMHGMAWHCTAIGIHICFDQNKPSIFILAPKYETNTILISKQTYENKEKWGKTVWEKYTAQWLPYKVFFFQSNSTFVFPFTIHVCYVVVSSRSRS